MLNLETSTDYIYIVLFFQHLSVSWTDDFIDMSPGNVCFFGWLSWSRNTIAAWQPAPALTCMTTVAWYLSGYSNCRLMWLGFLGEAAKHHFSVCFCTLIHCCPSCSNRDVNHKKTFTFQCNLCTGVTLVLVAFSVSTNSNNLLWETY